MSGRPTSSNENLPDSFCHLSQLTLGTECSNILESSPEADNDFQRPILRFGTSAHARNSFRTRVLKVTPRSICSPPCFRVFWRERSRGKGHRRNAESGERGNRLASRPRESGINQQLTGESRHLWCPKVEENSRTCAVFSGSLQRTLRPRTAWRGDSRYELPSPFPRSRRYPGQCARGSNPDHRSDGSGSRWPCDGTASGAIAVCRTSAQPLCQFFCPVNVAPCPRNR